MLNKEDILALAWEYSEGSGKRYTFTEDSLFEFLNELKKEPVPVQDEQQPVATVKYGGYTTGNQLLWKRGGGLQFLQEGTELYAGAIPQLRTVAYLDIGIGGYIDLGSDLTSEQLEALPCGRHMLGIVGTYGAEGYVPAAPIVQPCPPKVVQQTNKI